MRLLKLTAVGAMLFILSLPANAQKTKIKAKSGDTKSMPVNNGTNMNQNNAGTAATNSGTSMDDIPYTALYSSQAQIGDPANAKMIMRLYKDYETNAPRWKEAFADTAVVVNTDGTIWKGKDQIVQGFEKQSNAVSSFAFHPQAWMPVKFTDKNENWVLVWGSVTVTSKDGTQYISPSHEIWRINKDGKIDLMEQFEQKTTKQ